MSTSATLMLCLPTKRTQENKLGYKQICAYVQSDGSPDTILRLIADFIKNGKGDESYLKSAYEKDYLHLPKEYHHKMEFTETTTIEDEGTERIYGYDYILTYNGDLYCRKDGVCKSLYAHDGYLSKIRPEYLDEVKKDIRDSLTVLADHGILMKRSYKTPANTALIMRKDPHELYERAVDELGSFAKNSFSIHDFSDGSYLELLNEMQSVSQREMMHTQADSMFSHAGYKDTVAKIRESEDVALELSTYEGMKAFAQRELGDKADGVIARIVGMEEFEQMCLKDKADSMSLS